MQLVLINISDHSMRTRATNGGGDLPRVIGCLLGQHSGRAVEILNSFELVETPGAAACFDQDLFTSKREQYNEVFPTLDILGFYSTGPEVVPQDLQLQKKLAEDVEAPLLLSMDTAGTLAPGTTELPLQLYESGIWQLLDVLMHMGPDAVAAAVLCTTILRVACALSNHNNFAANKVLCIHLRCFRLLSLVSM